MGSVMKIPTEFTAIDKFTSVISKMTAGVSNFSSTSGSAVERFNRKLSKIGTGAVIAGAAITGGLGIAANAAIKFEDKMTDVAKTTGLSGKPLDDYGKSLLDMSKHTRTSIEDLQTIGEIGGQLGVASKDLISFTEASNQFNVALGSDYGGVDQAISQVGKINSLFKDTRKLDIATSITKAGSAINELGAVGAGTSMNINDFVLRIGALPDAIKPTLTQTAALGTFFEEVGIDSQIASGGFSNFLLVAGKNIGGFAKQMGLSKAAAKELFATDPSAFATKFAKSLNGLAPDKLAKKLEKLGIGSQETIKVLGALGSGSERLGKLMDISSQAFAKGTSLTDEYNKKNNDTAGKLAAAKNGIDAFVIVLGQQLLPVLGQLIEKVTPIIEKFGKMIENNPNLAATLLAVAGGLYAIKVVSWAATLATNAYWVAQGLSAFWNGAATEAQAANSIAMGVYSAATWIATVAASAFAIAVNLGLWPILAIIAAIAAIIAIFYYWDEIVAWFSKQWEKFTSWIGELWDKVVAWFQDFSFKDFFISIGQSIIDYMFFPLKKVLELVAKIPGKIGEAAQSGLDSLNKMTDLKSYFSADVVKKVDSPEQANAKQMEQNRIKGGVNVNIRDKGNNVESADAFGGGAVPINLTTTQGAF